MKVTGVKVFPVADDKLKAFVSVVIDHCFMVNDIKIIEGRDGRFISMPSRRRRNGKFKDIAHPLNTETRQMLEQEILREFERIENGHGPSQPAAAPAASEGAGAGGEQAPEAAPQAARDEAAGPAGEAAETAGESTLEEVTEKHLSDTFWTG